jgi:signal transduction histidine kinase
VIGRWRERWQALDPRRADGVIAVLLAVLLVVLLVAMESGEGPDAREGPLLANIAAGLVIIGALVIRRSHPLATAAIVATGAAVMQHFLTTPPAIPAVSFALMIASYSAAAHAMAWRSWLGLGLTAGTVLALSIAETPGDVLFPFIVFGVTPWVVGRILRSQTELARELAEQEARVRGLREREEAAAIARERTRVARELHDVLAHNLSVMVIQASGARRALTRDPRIAVEAAGLIERTAREALVELRQIFGPLHRGQGESLEGTVGLGQASSLIQRARDAGLDASLVLEGEPIPLDPGADAAAYRLIQEALTNSLKHAGKTAARVHVRFGLDGVSIAVADEGGTAQPTPLEGGGHGLVGMRERIELYDGDFEAGPRPEGGYEVRAFLPTRAGVAA